MRMRRTAVTSTAAVALFSLAIGPCPPPPPDDSIEVPGLSAPVRVVTDANGVRHLKAENDFDLALASGWIHARDRFFQMDLTRRQVSGDLAELLGPGPGGSLIEDDIEARVVGLRRAAQRSIDALPPRTQALFQAYADGVNAYLAANPLPFEYGLLELTQARPWEPVDTAVIGKAIAAQLSLDIDLGLAERLDAYVQAGMSGGFDGASLLIDDVMRSAPIDPASTVPDATGSTPFLASNAWKVDGELLARTGPAARRLRERFGDNPFFQTAVNRRTTWVGSNEWGVAKEKAEGNKPIIANDPHLSLNIPSTFYEWHLVVPDDPDTGRTNVSGVGFPGTPGVILGQNEHVTWGATTNPMDVSDVFLDELHVLTAPCLIATGGALACIRSDGVFHPVEIEFGVEYFFNVIGDSVNDNLAQAAVPPEFELIATVPFRSNGPILDIADTSVIQTGGITDAVVLQYTGFHATQEIQTFLTWNQAEDLNDFLDGLANFDVGSQNWAYADKDGNLAYFSSAENPLREDLEGGGVDGLPPFFIRDGTGGNNWIPDPAHSQGQAIPFAVLPASEMPQTVNPANGFFVNANNDPAGTTLDNNPLNQFRPGNPTAIYYLNPGYATGLRAGRITRLVKGKLDQGEKISIHDMQRFQANTQLLDAELITPFLLEAFENASAPGAPAELAALAADPEVAEAVGRLALWDYSTPTGLVEGYDASDFYGYRLPFVPLHERKNSVAATIYNVTRAFLIRNIIDARLASLGVPGVSDDDAVKAIHHLLVESPYDGVGASGVDFIPEPASLTSAADRRDLALLGAIRNALDELASSTYAAAFGNSTDQDDYRWGKLHRITFDHPLDPSFSVPPVGGFDDLSPDLSGVSVDGGFGAVDASSFNARNLSINGYKFGGGPVRRYVGQTDIGLPFGPMVLGFNAMPGGPSGDPFSPDYTTQLAVWLTNDYHLVDMRLHVPAFGGNTVENLVPPAP